MKKTENISRRQFISLAATVGIGMVLSEEVFATSAAIHKTISKTGLTLYAH